MTRSNRSRSKPSANSRLSLLLERGTYPRSVKKVSHVQAEVLSHLLTMMFIARQVGLKVSVRLSGKEL